MYWAYGIVMLHDHWGRRSSVVGGSLCVLLSLGLLFCSMLLSCQKNILFSKDSPIASKKTEQQVKTRARLLL